MENYTPNSHKYRAEQKADAPERKKQEKIVSGTVKTKKKSSTSKLAETFISEDAANVKSYIVMDVLIPAVKNLFADIVTDGINMLLFGGSRRSSGSSSSSRVPYVSYNRFSDKRDDRRSEPVARGRNGYSCDDIELETRGEAEDVLSRMGEIIDNYDGIVSVADLYEMVGLPTKYTDFKYGWTSVRNVEIVRLRGGGYLLKFPRPCPIDN